jgi:hypothetical protein
MYRILVGEFWVTLGNLEDEEGNRGITGRRILEGNFVKMRDG